MGIAARLFSNLSPSVKHEIQRFRYKYMIAKGRFYSDEKEAQLVEKLIEPGATVIDIGANVGYYTLQFSRLVGPWGMVLAFEPITRTFDLLSSNVFFAGCEKVTLVNTVVSKEAGTVGFTVPDGNYFQAHMSADGELQRMAIPLATFDDPNWEPTFVKIDAEGLDLDIIKSSAHYLNVHRPMVMAELASESMRHAVSLLDGYTAYSFKGSHNGFLVPEEKESDFLSRARSMTLDKRL